MPKSPKGVTGSNSHSIDPELNRVVQQMNRQFTIKKFVPGKSKRCRHSHRCGAIRVKRKTPNGYAAVGYLRYGVVDLYLVTADSIPLGAEFCS